MNCFSSWNRRVEMVGPELRGRVVVISPHLDDAVLALGATLARAVKLGAEVEIVTVFAGDPASATPAGVWDRGCGFRSAGKAAHARRKEDQRACTILGAKPVWLPFSDNQYDRDRDAARVGAALAPHVEKADVLLLPGFPLTHPDHVCATAVVLGTAPQRARIGFYVEQPYVRESGLTPAASDGYGTGVGGPLQW